MKWGLLGHGFFGQLGSLMTTERVFSKVKHYIDEPFETYQSAIAALIVDGSPGDK